MSIRAYQAADRDVLNRVCYESALMGESIAPLFGSQRLFTDYWMTYYLEHEPESAFVAVDNDGPVGYLVGCCDTRRFEATQQTVVWPRIWRRFLLGRYGVPLPLARFLWRVVRSRRHDRHLAPRLQDYPAHLHMNVAAGYRGRGHGALLLDGFLAYLEQRGVPGVHLITTNLNRAAVPLYESRGFRLEDRAPLSIYDAYVSEPVEALLYVRTVPALAAAEASP